MKMQSPWMGRVSGSAGQMTGCKMYDSNVMRAKAFEVANPNTQAQKTQRDFFTEVSKIVAGVSEAELRSLFGQLPKKMSRRNALSKQMFSLLSENKDNIEEYEGKNFSIGNGEKVTTNVFYFDGSEVDYEINWDLNQFGNAATAQTSVVYVIFNLTRKKLYIINSSTLVEDFGDTINYYPEITTGDKVICYPTCAADGSSVEDKSFGTFTLKTRQVDKSEIQPVEPEQIDIKVSGLGAWDTFTVDLSGTSAVGGEPTQLLNDDNVVCNGFTKASENVYTGSFTSAVDGSASSQLVVTMPNSSTVTLNVNFV